MRCTSSFFFTAPPRPSAASISSLARRWRHALLAALARRFADPAHRQRRAAHRAHFHRHLVVGAADAAALHLHHRLHVVDRGAEHLEGVLAGLLRDGVERAVQDPLGDRLLAARHQHVHELGDFLALVLRIRKDLAFGNFSAARHRSPSVRMIAGSKLTRLWAAWRRTWSATACDPSRRRCPGCRAPCGSARPAGPSRGRRGSAPPSAPAGCGLRRRCS